MSLLDIFRRWFGARPVTDTLSGEIQSEQRIFADASGIGIRRRSGEIAWMPWNDVDEIRAWKIDLLTTDELRIGFADIDGNSLEISEEHPGYEQLVAELSVRFPGIGAQLMDVLDPAFERKETRLFKRGVA